MFYCARVTPKRETKTVSSANAANQHKNQILLTSNCSSCTFRVFNVIYYIIISYNGYVGGRFSRKIYFVIYYYLSSMYVYKTNTFIMT